MKHLSLLALFCVCAVTAFAQRAATYTGLAGGTNNVAANATNTYTTVTLATPDVDNVGIAISFKPTATNSTDAAPVFVISEGMAGSYETWPKYRFTVPLNNTNTVFWITNIVVPSASALSLTSVEWTTAAGSPPALTNVYFYWRPKIPARR